MIQTPIHLPDQVYCEGNEAGHPDNHVAEGLQVEIIEALVGVQSQQSALAGFLHLTVEEEDIDLLDVITRRDLDGREVSQFTGWKRTEQIELRASICS